MDNFEYVDMDKIQLKTGEGDEKPDEKVLVNIMPSRKIRFLE